ncbi:DNA repair protein RecO [Tropicimonas isoalkanivorans]|uniref:DNA repair protein RecO n=1 Tax=Tropicimonas isoalkanivorans TaxID=441112 RepID=A0A1I1PVF4_9RHOB|nr:DNA repair protein RecO [Tropicimonas isoalkanivorans]SFD13755.1 DNA replication and repair protein RecO [Tropicimonas isoalkanivorans]
MDWRDEGALLTVRPHGETSAIVEVFTATHGRHAGVVRGGISRKLTPTLQPGTQLSLEWRARLDEHIGTFRVEPLRSRTAAMMGDRLALHALASTCALLSFALAERDPQPGIYAATQHLLDALGTEARWPSLYLLWEMALLEELGFGLDLSRCAVTGATEGLAFVSPKTGRAVTAEGAGDWADRLLPLTPSLLGVPSTDRADLLAGLRVTGHFLASRLAPALGDRPLPPARERFVERLARDERSA